MSRILTEAYDVFARRLEHAALSSETDAAAVRKLCRDALAYRIGAVVVNPAWIGTACAEIGGSAVRVIATVGFPLGANVTAIKVAEAVQAVEDGAREIDMVANIGLLVSEQFDDVSAEIRKVRRNIPESVALKVIIETARLPESSLPSAVDAVVAGGAQFVKTGTGFFGGASGEVVRLLTLAANRRIEVKASGGIRTLDQCLALIEAGASRLGSSACPTILDEYRRRLA